MGITKAAAVFEFEVRAAFLTSEIKFGCFEV